MPSGPTTQDLPALVTIVEPETDQQRFTVDRDLTHGGPSTLPASLGVPGQHLVSIPAGRRGGSRRAPLDVRTQEGAEGVEIGRLEAAPDVVRYGQGRARCRWAAPVVVTHPPSQHLR